MEIVSWCFCIRVKSISTFIFLSMFVQLAGLYMYSAAMLFLPFIVEGEWWIGLTRSWMMNLGDPFNALIIAVGFIWLRYTIFCCSASGNMSYRNLTSRVLFSLWRMYTCWVEEIYSKHSSSLLTLYSAVRLAALQLTVFSPPSVPESYCKSGIISGRNI